MSFTIYDANGNAKLRSQDVGAALRLADTMARQSGVKHIVVDKDGNEVKMETPDTGVPSLNRDAWKANKVDGYNALEVNRVKSMMRFLKSLAFCMVEKRHGSSAQSGHLDLFGCVVGLHYEIEAKRDGQGPTPLQKSFMDKWAAAGAIVSVCRDAADIQNLFTAAGINWQELQRIKKEQQANGVPEDDDDSVD